METCYRLAQKAGSACTTVVTVSLLKFNHEIKLKVASLKSLGLFITDDLPYEWVYEKKKLRPSLANKKIASLGRQEPQPAGTAK